MVMNSKDRAYAAVGALVIASAVAFTGLFFYATNRTLGSGRTQLWVALPSAEGLRKGDQLLFRGVQVGEVRALEFAADGSVLVRTVVTRPLPLSRRASARLVAADMFGRQTLVLEAGPAAPPLASGDTLFGVAPPGMNGRIEGVASRIERMVGDTTVSAVHLLLADAASAAVALESALRTMQQTVAAQAEPLHRTVQATALITENVRIATDTSRLAAAADRTNALLARLDGTAARMDTVATLLAGTLARVDEGHGSLGRLTTDEALYERAVAAMTEVELLLADVRRDPKRYFTVRVF